MRSDPASAIPACYLALLCKLPHPSSSHLRRLIRMVAKSTANPANNPTEAPRPMHSGWNDPERSVIAALSSSGIEAVGRAGASVPMSQI
jgi:hypothetical protein